jgi:hypothetical protein
VPTAVGVKAADVAVAVVLVAAVSDTAEPTAVLPLGQPLALLSGPQTKKLIVPVGLPPVAFPVTVAPSVLESPRTMLADVGVVTIDRIALQVPESPSESVQVPDIELLSAEIVPVWSAA